MTRCHITRREIRQADARYRQRCLPARPRGRAWPRGRPQPRAPAPGWGTLRQLAWTAGHGQYCPPHASATGSTGVRRPPRTARARAATAPSADGPVRLLCWQATRLTPGRVTRCRRARRARR